jgi:hypothetical protein
MNFEATFPQTWMRGASNRGRGGRGGGRSRGGRGRLAACYAVVAVVAVVVVAVGAVVAGGTAIRITLKRNPLVLMILYVPVLPVFCVLGRGFTVGKFLSEKACGV